MAFGRYVFHTGPRTSLALDVDIHCQLAVNAHLALYDLSLTFWRWMFQLFGVESALLALDVLCRGGANKSIADKRRWWHSGSCTLTHARV